MPTKEEIVNQFKSGLDAAVDTLYVAAKDEGVAQGIAEGRAQLQAEIDSLPPTPVPVDDGSGAPVQGHSEEDVQKMLADKEAAVRAEMQSILDAKQADLDKALSDDESDKTKIAHQAEVIGQIKSLIAGE
jgi:hypothetical protein